ncbi:MAG: redox-regulated ATPase YchF [Firmicutes bacterium]|nr:redox-regulated ATPase YchF [Bacillota bacterium]MBR7113914.1 redox-regulated ATPase YchF [Bacillota bacterium]
MALSCGIIGLPTSGKTTFFNLLTGSQAETSAWGSGKTTANDGHAYVPDERLDYLTEMFHPKKTTYAQLEIIDVPGLVKGAYQGKGGNDFLAAVRDADALAQIVRAFNNDEVLHPDGSIDILRDIETINMELIFADLQLIETRLERISGGSKKKMENPLEEGLLMRCRDFLEGEKPLKLLELNEEEREALKHITFLTNKPMLIVINVDEDQYAGGDYPGKADVEAYCAEQGYEVLVCSAKIEEEISHLDEEEKAMFMEELGISESGVSRMAKAVYTQLGLISFLTAGEDEVRAWTIRKGLPAKQAAGKIHSDIERGFIRAETVAFADLKQHGSMAAAREKGCFRLEGKEYAVQDGDIINFRFNV